MGKRRRAGIGLLAAGAALAAAAGAFAVGGTFLEPDVQVVRQFDGTGSQSFGWAVSTVADPKHKHRLNALVSEAFDGPNFDRGSAWLYSSRTGALLRSWQGQAGDWFAFAVADAGDVNHDEASDILLGAPRADADHGPGYVDLRSGRTDALLRRFTGAAAGDAFGWAVSSAGDVNGDHHADILVGAPDYHTHASPGHAYIYSGKTYAPIRTLTGDAPGDEFGSGVGMTEDVNGDHVPDQIVGAREAPAADGKPRGKVYVYSGRTGARLFTIDPSPKGVQFGSFFVAGVGDVNRDRVPDIYAADYSDRTNGVEAGRAAVYSGRDGSELLSWLGHENDGLGPGRGAGDVNHDGRPDVIVGSYTASDGAPLAGKVQIFSGADGSVLRTFTSTTAGENLGFDAVGIGDVNHDHVPDALLAAATGDHVYIVAGSKQKK